MAPTWTASTAKHGVDRADAIYAILNATFTEILAFERPAKGRIRLFIGPRHAQALEGDEVEILVHEFPDSDQQAVVFHVMPLGAKYRNYREESHK